MNDLYYLLIIAVLLAGTVMLVWGVSRLAEPAEKVK
jgi:hypothetical protein